MKTFFQALVNFGAGILAGFFILSQLSFHKDDKKEVKTKELTTHQWYAPPIPDKMEFAGETVPLNKWDVKERFDRELLFNYYWQNNILYMHKLANRYFPVIEERLKAHGVPLDFKYLCIAESNLLANATSKAGAVGFWQFLSGTAPQYQLEVNNQVDKRRHIIESTDAACKYLKQAYAKFGSWTAAAASYNCGMGGYNSQATLQKTKNYYDLLLTEETHRYIFRILAFKYLMENSTDLGFVLTKDELYHPVKTRTVTVNSSIPSLVQFALDNGTDYKTLKLLNPWLRSTTLSVAKGKSYIIHLPA